MKKIILTLLCGLIFATATAQTTWNIGTPTATDIIATLHNDTMTIAGTGAMMNWSFSTARPWSEQNANIRTVIINNGVTSIGDNAFRDCSSLTSVTIGSSVISIGGSAFNGTGLTTVTIPNTVTSIGGGTFSGCTNLKEFIIEDGTTELQFNSTSGSFTNSPIETLYLGRNFWSSIVTLFGTQVKKLTIGSNINSLGRWAFAGYTDLTELIIKDGMTTLTLDGTGTQYAFYNCPIETLYFGRNITHSLTTAPFGRSVKLATIGDSVTIIPNYLFSGCIDLSTIEIPKNIISIEESAFSGCTGLTSVIIPNSVTEIGNNAFSDCANLTSVTIPNGITIIRSSAFVRSGLTSVAIPSSVTIIESYAFTNIRELIIEDGITTLTISGGIVVESFYNSPIETLYLGRNVSTSAIAIGTATLQQLTIGDSVTEIGDYAFYGCKNLNSLTIGSSVETIGINAFFDCTGLKTVTIQNPTPPTVSSNAFNGVTVGNIPLYVPLESVGNYRKANVWKDFYLTGNNSYLSWLELGFDDTPTFNDTLFIPITPRFSDTIFVYNVTVSNSTTEITIHAFAEDSMATISGDGLKQLVVGDNVFEIVVVSEDGTGSKTYTITVTRRPIYTLSFNSRGGSEVSPQSIEDGFRAWQPYSALFGYTLVGWVKDTNSSLEENWWDFRSDTVTADMTLYAMWRISTYRVNFDSQGGSSVSTQIVEHGGLAEDPTPPTRTGHTFDGWHTIEFVENRIDTLWGCEQFYLGEGIWFCHDSIVIYDTTLWDFSQNVITSDMTLHALWTPHSYTVTFNSQGGSEIPSQTIFHGNRINWPGTPTLYGHTFDGWYKIDTIFYDFDTGYTIVDSLWDFSRYTVTSDITLFAKWSVTTFTVYLIPFHWDDTIYTQTILHGEKIIKPEDPTQEGYTFKGWLEARSEVLWDFENNVVTSDLFPWYNVVHLYGRWDVNTYTVTFNSQGGSEVDPQTIEYEKKITEPTTPTRTGYTFGGWYSTVMVYYFDSIVECGAYRTDTVSWDFSRFVVTSDTTLFAKWTRNEYIVSFNSQGGSSVTSQIVIHGGRVSQPVNPTRTHHTFGGWFRESDCINVWNFATDTVTESTTFFAKWTINSYTVTFNSQGGSDVASQIVNHGEKATEPTVPTRTGHTFGGWFKESTCVNAWNFATDTVISNITLFAKWTANTYIVNIQPASNGTITVLNGSTPLGSVTVLEHGTILSLVATANPGFEFVRWWDNDNNMIRTNYEVVSHITISAVFVEIGTTTFNVTFNSHGGSNVNSQIVAHGEKVTEPTPPTRSGYTFAGWYREHTHDNAWDFHNHTVTDHITLHAKWSDESTSIRDSQHSEQLKAWVQNGRLHVKGLPIGQRWSLYNISGTLIYQGVANSDEVDIKLQTHGIYIIQTETTSLKIVW